MKIHRRSLSLVLVLALLSGALLFTAGCDLVEYCEPKAGVACRVDFTSTVDGTRLPATIYLPNNYDPSKSYPVWMELHALYSTPIINNDTNDPFSNQLKKMADDNGVILFAPWGRNLHSLYIDGVNKDSGPNAEPHFTDNLSSLTDWRTISGTWAADSNTGYITQHDSSGAVKELVRTGSSGADYSIRVRAREATHVAGVSSFGVNLRRNASGECYHVDLCTDSSNGATHKYVRLLRYASGAWTLIYQTETDWQPLSAGDNWINLKVNDYAGYIEVYVNDNPINMQPNYDNQPYGYGRFCYDLPVSGEVALTSMGGTHDFEEFSIQNEYEFGERDLMDCLGQFLEKYDLDESRIYLAGHSQGGLGVYTAGLHNPGVFAAGSVSDGLSDLVYDYQFLFEHFPRNPGSPYADVNDGQLTDYMRTINGVEDSKPATLDTTLMRDNSARYILENAVNLPLNIVHGTPDGTIPNCKVPIIISWWGPWLWFWGQVQAPSPYSPTTPAYANGEDIYDLLSAWSSSGAYSADYLTDPYAGHGFMEPYADTYEFFSDKVLDRHPAQVAYKTYDDTESASYWMKMKRYTGAGSEAAITRATYTSSANSISAHARNVEQLALDLKYAGLDCGAGKTITINLDNNVAPVNMPVADVCTSTSMVLTHNWPNPAGVKVYLDGTLLTSGTGYSWSGQTLTVPGVNLSSSHVLTLVSPASQASNLLSNPGFETAASDGSAASWTSVLETGGSAAFQRSTRQPHAGNAAARIKNPAPGGSSYLASLQQNVSGITAGRSYALSVFVKTRMLTNAAVRAEIVWLNSSGNTISTSTSPVISDSGYSNRNWEQLYLKATAPTGAVSARVRLQTAGSATAGTGSAFFDDASLYLLP